MAYRDRYTLIPLRITAYLRTPVVSDRWLPLDGILLYQAHRDLFGAQDATIPGEYIRKGVQTLPLGIKHPGRRIWYYQCSWAQWPEIVAKGQDHWNKRFDAGLADLINLGKKRKIVIESGKYRAYHYPIFYRSALWIRWYAVGDLEEIKRLLSTVTHIGKKGVQGWGRVRRWEIRKQEDDWSVWRDGKLMRGIPIEAYMKERTGQEIPPDLTIANYGIRPSYWKRSNQRQVVMPA